MRVTHLSVDPATAGGVATVVRTLVQHAPRGITARSVHTYHPDARFAGVALAAHAARRLLRGDRDELGVVHVHLSKGGSLLREGGLLWLARARRLPVCVTLHSGRAVADLPRRPRLWRRLLSGAGAVVVLGPTARAAAVGIGLRTVEVVGNPVVLPPTASPASAQARVVLFVGERGIAKGVPNLLSAWPAVRAAVPDAELHLVGSLADVERLDGPGVRWWGSVAPADVAAHVESARVVALPSHAEGMPLALLEAMASARPVVASDVGEIPHLVGDAGAVVAIGDPQQLAAELVRLLEDGAAADRAGTAGRERVRRLFSTEAVGSQLRAVYESLAAA